MIFLKGSISDSIVDREVNNFIEKVSKKTEEEFVFILEEKQISVNVDFQPRYENSVYILNIYLVEKYCFDDGEKVFFADMEIDSYVYSLIAENKYQNEIFEINIDTREFFIKIKPTPTQLLINRKSVFSLLEYCNVKKEKAYEAIKRLDEMN